MAWQDEMIIILRTLVSDVTAITYSDDTLATTLVVAGRYVSQELVFSQRYACDVVNQAITPDPSVAASRDESFINLTCYKAACFIDRGSAIIAAQQAISVKDGSSSVDLRGILEGKLKLLDKGWCAVYDDAKLEYQAGQVRIAGAAVMGPFRVYARSIGSGFFTSVPGREREAFI
jgi:hypothetical protein